MKKTTYIRDIEDTLGKNDFSKDAVRIAKKIQSTQKKAFPSIEYKQHLGDRLSNIYALQLEEDVVPRFSLLQIFVGFASFIFIAGGLFSIYQMSSISEIKVPEKSSNSAASTTISSEGRTVSENSGNIDAAIGESTSPKMLRMPESISSDDSSTNIQSRSLNMQYENNENGEIESDFLPQDSIESDAFESSMSDEEYGSNNSELLFEQMGNITRQEMCELVGGEYQSDPEICNFPNGVQCGEYSERSILACAQRDASTLKDNTQ